MPELLKLPKMLEHADSSVHPDFVEQETRVSEFYRMYSKGQIDRAPESHYPEVVDKRTVDEMLSDEFEPSLGTESVEVMQILEANSEKFEKAFNEMKQSKARIKQFKQALNTYNSPYTSKEQKLKAHEILTELTRARD